MTANEKQPTPVNQELRVNAVFDMLDRCNARYYLLRPIDLHEEVKDIDVVMPQEDVNVVIAHIKSHKIKATYTTSIAENSIAIVIGDMVLDVKTRVCFFASKFYAFNEPPPYAGIKKVNGHIIIPDVEPWHLFTFWSLHLFLDKTNPEDSSSYHLFKDFYGNNWMTMMENHYVREWHKLVWGNFSSIARKRIRTFMGNGFEHRNEDNDFLKNLVLSQHVLIHLTYYFEKLKYGIIRRIKRNLYKPVEAYTC
ncbi:MAG: hypothetical protein KDC12_10615 [Flavobacteriales bacterium]|nr:hypothetical protein [Flavobacteriales bacterium]